MHHILFIILKDISKRQKPTKQYLA